MMQIDEIILKAVRLSAEMRPRPTQVDFGQACEMLDITRPTLRKIINAGAIRLNSCGKIPIEEIDRARSARAV